VKTLVTLGIVFGVLAVLSITAGFVAVIVPTAVDRHQFDGGHLSVDLKANQVYAIKESVAGTNTVVYMGTCSFSGPAGAHGVLDAKTTSTAYGTNDLTPYTFVTDTAGTYEFSCHHNDSRTRADAPFVLQPESYPTDPLIFGLPLGLVLLLPAALGTLIPGLVLRSRLKRARTAPAGPAGYYPPSPGGPYQGPPSPGGPYQGPPNPGPPPGPPAPGW